MQGRKKLALAILIQYAVIIVLLTHAVNVYEGCTVYLDGDGPFIWGKSPSAAYAAVVNRYTSCLYVGVIAAVYLLVTKNSTDNLKEEIAAYIVCLLSSAAGIIYMLNIGSKYYQVIYDTGIPFVDGEGNQAELLQSVTWPLVISALGVILIIFCMIDVKRRKEIQ